MWSAIPRVTFLPSKLEELCLRSCIHEDLSPLTDLSGLSRVELRLGEGAESSLGCLSGLRSLRFLGLLCDFAPSGLLTTFKTLSRLTVVFYQGGLPEVSLLPDLAKLTGLSHLKLSDLQRAVSRRDFACLSHLTRLTGLDMTGCKLADTVRSSCALVPLTRLVSLGFTCGDVGLAVLRSLKVEALQTLALSDVRGDVLVLQRATGLTKLVFSCNKGGVSNPRDLGITLKRMSMLRSLTLELSDDFRSASGFRLRRVLRGLTNLSSLKYGGRSKPRKDLSACASLPRLRSLCLEGCRKVTPTYFPILQSMSGLTELILRDTGIRHGDVTPKITAGFDVERIRRGWPGLKITCS